MSISLLDFLKNLLWDEDAREAFADDPQGSLAEAGLGHLTADDVQDALVLINEDNQGADFSRDYNTGGNHIAAPSAPVHHDGGDESAVEYINRYITNNYVDDRDTITDNSINQQIDTGGGDFDQDIDIDSTVASGDGAVAAGDDINGDVVTGDGNQVGDGNVNGEGNVVGDGNETVNGDGNTTSFGNGDANSTTVGDDLNIGDGGAFASGGNASVDNSDNSLDNVGNDYSDNSQENVGNDNSDNSLDNVGNDYSDNSDNSDNSAENVGNDYSDHSDNSDNSTEDSFNTQIS